MLFLWIIFELLYCYDMKCKIFSGSIFYTFFPLPFWEISNCELIISGIKVGAPGVSAIRVRIRASVRCLAGWRSMDGRIGKRSRRLGRPRIPEVPVKAVSIIGIHGKCQERYRTTPFKQRRTSDWCECECWMLIYSLHLPKRTVVSVQDSLFGCIRGQNTSIGCRHQELFLVTCQSADF